MPLPTNRKLNSEPTRCSGPSRRNRERMCFLPLPAFSLRTLLELRDGLSSLQEWGQGSTMQGRGEETTDGTQPVGEPSREVAPWRWVPHGSWDSGLPGMETADVPITFQGQRSGYRRVLDTSYTWTWQSLAEGCWGGRGGAHKDATVARATRKALCRECCPGGAGRLWHPRTRADSSSRKSSPIITSCAPAE